MIKGYHETWGEFVIKDTVDGRVVEAEDKYFKKKLENIYSPMHFYGQQKSEKVTINSSFEWLTRYFMEFYSGIVTLTEHPEIEPDIVDQEEGEKV